ncbi:amino acid adenylation domain-containing protein [Micromonospora echinospora]
MWLAQEFVPAQPNNVVTLWEIDGDLDVARMASALRHSVGEAAAVRVNFQREELLRQVVRDAGGWEPFHHDVSGLADPDGEARALVASLTWQPFDLARDALLRLGTIRLSATRHLLVLIFHHIITDAYGVVTLLSQRIARVYRELMRNAEVPASDWPPPEDAVRADEAYLSSRRCADAERFWQEYLSGAPTAARLPDGVRSPAADLAAPAGPWDFLTAPLGMVTRTVPVPAADRLAWERRAQESATGVTDLLTAAAVAYLQRMCDLSEPLHSITVNQRTGRARRSLGLLSNRVPMRVTIPPGISLVELSTVLRRERATVLRHARHELSLIKRATGLAAEARSPFGAVVNVIPFVEVLDLAGSTGRFAGGTFGVLDEVLVSVYTDGTPGSDLFIRLDAPAAQFAEEDLAGLTHRLAAFVRAALADPSVPVSDLPLLDTTEEQRLNAARSHRAAPALDVTLIGSLERRARSAPDTVAVTVADDSLTYRQLADRSGRLARLLIQQGAGPGRVVAVGVPRSPDLVVAFVAVLTTGAAFVHVPPELPASRKQAVLDDAGPVLLIVPDRAAGDRPDLGVPVVTIDAVPETGAPAPARSHCGADPACLTYTAGPDGQLHGAVITHAALADRLLRLRNLLSPEETDRVLQHTAASDGSVDGLLAPLLSGATCVLTTPDDAAAIEKAGVTTLYSVPSVLAELLDGDPAPFRGSLRRVVCRGEELTAGLAARLRDTLGVPVHNLYGLIEAGAGVTTWQCPAEAVTIPIGAPAGGARVLVLDRRLRPVPPGVRGELYVTGPGLARGYHGRPARTAERFVACPFGPAGQLMYRTGDRGRWNACGEIEYAGRADSQVKIAGMRVEPAEVEAALAAHPGVAGVAVTARRSAADDAATQLVAFVVPATADSAGPQQSDWDYHAGLDIAELRAFASTRVPAHMVPAAFAIVDRIPRTLGGAPDRAALPVLAFTARTYRPPRTAAERTLTTVFAQVIGLDRVGVDDDFFTLGGDSIRAILVVARARAEGLVFTPRSVFEHRTVSALAAAARHDAAPAALAELDGGGIGLMPLPPMARLIAERGPGLDRLAQWLLLQLPDGVGAGDLTAAVNAVLDRHDVLRSRLTGDGLTVVAPGDVDAADLIRRTNYAGAWTEHPWLNVLHDAAAEAVADIDASAGRMLRLVWFAPRSGGPGRLLVAAHHLVVDGLSWRVLLSDLALAWQHVRAGRAPVLPAVGTSLRRWLRALSEEAARPGRMAELPLWRDLLAGPVVPVGSRPLDPKRDLVSTTETLRAELPPGLTGAVLTMIPAAWRCGADDVLLTALVLALAKHRRGIRDSAVVVRLEGHGRTEELVPGADLSRTAGWFTAVQPVRFDVSGIDVDEAIAGGPAAREAVRRVTGQRNALPGDGNGYTLLRYLNTETGTVLRDLPAEEIGFNFLGHFSFDEMRASDGAGWTPAPECAELVAAPGPAMPALHALALDALVTNTGDGARLTALFTFATGLLSAAEVEEMTGAWHAALRGLHASAARGHARITPQDLPLVNVGRAELDTWQQRHGRLADVWPQTPLQAGLLFHTMLADPGTPAYQTQFVFRLRGRADAGRLRAAGQALLDRCPNLRVAFHSTAAGEPVQVVVDRVKLPWRHLDLTGADDAEEQLERVIDAERDTPFAVDAPPLLRFVLVTVAADQSHLILTAHHALFDGWSVPLIEQELMRLYRAGGAGEGPAPAIGYRDFLDWMSRQDAARSADAWSEELAGLQEPTLLAPGARPERTGSGQVAAPLSSQDAALLGRRAADLGVTVNVLVQGAWALVLAGLTGRDDVLFGATVSGRPSDLPGVDAMIGLFINTIPVRVRCTPTEDLPRMLRRLQSTQAGLLEHHHVGLADIQRATGLSALFDTLLVFESFPVDRTALAAGGAAQDLAVAGVRPYSPPHYPLTIIASADPFLRLSLHYQRYAFEQADVEAIASRLARVLRQIAARPQAGTGAFEVLTAQERDQVLHRWNDTAAEAPRQTVAEQFSARAAATPYAVALEHDGRTMTYQELDERSNRLAHWLIGRGVRPEARVVVLLPRSTDLVVALLAVWKAGGAYVPVDPDYPAARVRAVIESSEPALVLDEALLGAADLSACPATGPGVASAAAQAAYAIYTSGSTGRPKGVVVEHVSLTNLLGAMQGRFALTPDDRVLAIATVAFDIAVLELFLPLLAGARVVLASRSDVLRPAALLELVHRSGVTVMQATPALWQVLVTHDAAFLTKIRVISTGEALPGGLAEQLAAAAAEVTNLYGPTEATVYSSAARPVPGGPGMPPSVGSPVANYQLFVLNHALRPVPPGATGDLWIAGHGLARGYLGQPALTADRFVANPYGPPGSRMYRTGDLARWTPTGEVEYLGRSDQQIKLRGHRIEPAEIERVLTGHGTIRQAVVVAREDRAGQRRLVAYVVPEPAAEAADAEVLRALVGEQLPAYMVPAAVVTLERLPLTPNGKVDRSALPAPKDGRNAYRAPLSDRDTALCRLFGEVLGVDRVGMDDDFFALGGHSLLATRLVARVRADLGIEIPIRTLFTHPTVAGLTDRWSEMSLPVRKQLRRMIER